MFLSPQTIWELCNGETLEYDPNGGLPLKRDGATCVRINLGREKRNGCALHRRVGEDILQAVQFSQREKITAPLGLLGVPRAGNALARAAWRVEKERGILGVQVAYLELPKDTPVHRGAHLEKYSTIILIENVSTTGASAWETVQRLERCGVTRNRILVVPVIDRGGAMFLRSNDVEVLPLATLKELAGYWAAMENRLTDLPQLLEQEAARASQPS